MFTKKKITLSECFTALSLVVIEFLAALGMKVDFFDVGSKTTKTVLFIINFIIALAVYHRIAALVKFPKNQRFKTALWGVASWYGLGLSYFSYIGYLLIPIEIFLGYLTVRIFTSSSRRQAFVVCISGRLVFLTIQLLSTFLYRRYLS